MGDIDAVDGYWESTLGRVTEMRGESAEPETRRRLELEATYHEERREDCARPTFFPEKSLGLI